MLIRQKKGDITVFEQYSEILTIDEVADLLLIGRSKVYNMLRTGELPAFRIGEVWKIPKKGIEDYILTQSGLNRNHE